MGGGIHSSVFGHVSTVNPGSPLNVSKRQGTQKKGSKATRYEHRKESIALSSFEVRLVELVGWVGWLGWFGWVIQVMVRWKNGTHMGFVGGVIFGVRRFFKKIGGYPP